MVREAGIDTDVNPLSPEHKHEGILVTLLPKLNVEILVHPANAGEVGVTPAEIQQIAL
jgi:hypothetical protein